MDSKLFHSTEFYKRRYQNFATLSIIPIFLLLGFLIVFSVFATKEIAISSVGELTPVKQITNQKLPDIKKARTIALTYYVDSSNYSSVKKGQKVIFTIPSSSGERTILKGKVKSIDTIPRKQHETNLYQITANITIKPSQAKHLAYGLQGNVSNITKKETYFNYYKKKILHQ